MARPPIIKNAILQHPVDMDAEEIRRRLSEDQGLETSVSYIYQVRKDNGAFENVKGVNDQETRFIQAAAEIGIVRSQEILEEIRLKALD